MDVSLKDKKGIPITNAFQKNLDRSGRKPNKIWVDQGNEFYNRSNRSIKLWLQDNGIEIFKYIMEENMLLREIYLNFEEQNSQACDCQK